MLKGRQAQWKGGYYQLLVIKTFIASEICALGLHLIHGKMNRNASAISAFITYYKSVKPGSSTA